MIEPASGHTRDRADRFVLRARLALAVLVAFAVLVDLVLWRRIAGRWVPPETPWLALSAATLVGLAQGVAWCVFAQNAIRASHPFATWLVRRTRLSTALGMIVVAGPAGLVGLALFPVAHEFAAGGLAAVIVLLAAGTWCLTAESGIECAVREESPTPFSKRPLDSEDAVESRANLSRSTPLHDEERDAEEDVEEPDGSDDEGLLQQVRRTRAPDGSQALDATLAAEFPAGARNVSVHLPIWPQLPGGLEVTAEAVDEVGDDVRVAIGLVRSFGIRLDVRRAESIENPARVVIGVAVRTRPAVSAAAAED